MRFKNIIAGLIAGVMTVASVSVTSFAQDVFVEDCIDRKMASGDTFTEGDLEYTELDDDTLSVKYAGNDAATVTKIVIPETVKGKSVSTISRIGFIGLESLKSISLPKTLKKIEKNAFMNCCSLEALTLPKGLKCIEEYAFEYCTNIKTMHIPNSVEEIQEGAFVGCKSLENFTTDSTALWYKAVDGVLYRYNSKDNMLAWVEKYPPAKKATKFVDVSYSNAIRYGAFQDCSYLEEIDISSAVTQIDWYAFANCTSLTKISLPDNITVIGDFAFTGCLSLESIELPHYIRNIESGTFSNCYSLRAIRLPGVSEIKQYAFLNCISLKSVYYTGSQENWDSISVQRYNDALLNADFYYNAKHLELPPVVLSGFSASDVTSDSVSLEWDIYYPAKCYKVWIWKDNKWTFLYQTKDSQTLSYNITNLASNTSYKLRLSAYNKKNTAIAHSDITIKTKVGEIANLKATSKENSIKLSWNKNALVSYYKVFIWKNSKWTELTKTKNNTILTYTATKLVPNTSYEFRVTAYNKSNKAIAYSDITSNTKIGKIANLQATPGIRLVKFKWSKFANADSYYIWLLHNGYRYKIAEIKGGTKFNYTLEKLNPDTSYKFRVSAYKGNTEIAYSDITLKTQKEKITVGNLEYMAFDDGTAEVYGPVDQNLVKATILSTVNGKKVTRIGDRAFSECSSLTRITIPSSVTSIGEKAFDIFVNLKDIYYTGSKAQWGKVTINYGNWGLEYSTIHYNYHQKIKDLKAAPTNSSIKLTWCKNTSASFYKVWIWQNSKWTKLIQTKNNSVLSYNKTGLQANTSYKFRVTAYNKSNTAIAYSDITVKTKCGKIADLKVAPSKNNAKITWSKNTSAKYYKVFVWKNNKWTQLTQTANNSVVNYTASNLTVNTAYKYRVTAYNSSNKAIAFSDISTRTLANIANLKAAPTKNSVKLTWSRNASAKYYKVFVWNNGKYQLLKQLNNSTAPNYTAANLKLNTAYKYRVTAYNTSNKAIAFSDISTRTLANISNLKAVPAKNSVKLTWSKNTSAKYYKVFVWKNNKWTQLTQTKSNSVLTYTASKLTANTSYKFRVTAYNASSKVIAFSDITVKTKK